MKKPFRILFLILSINTFSNFNVSYLATDLATETNVADQSTRHLVCNLAAHNARIMLQVTKELWKELQQKLSSAEHKELFLKLQNISFSNFKEEVKQLPKETLLKIQDIASKITWKTSSELMKKSLRKAKKIVLENPETTISTIVTLILITAFKEQIKTTLHLSIDIAFVPIEILYLFFSILG